MIPRVSFLIGGAQKAGTTALASVVAQHPFVVLPNGKEAHVFDAPDASDSEDTARVNERFSTHFAEPRWSDPGIVVGDATPITVLHPVLVARVARYNPAMRWIILLRDPVDRAVSQWHMERERGAEDWPMTFAFLAEKWRLRGHDDDFSDGSPLRHHSYLARSRYRAQCRELLRHFPREQLLILRTEDLTTDPAGVLRAVWKHIGVAMAEAPEVIPRVFAGGYRRVHRWHPARLIARIALMRDDPWSFIDEECPRV